MARSRDPAHVALPKIAIDEPRQLKLSLKGRLCQDLEAYRAAYKEAYGGGCGARGANPTHARNLHPIGSELPNLAERPPAARRRRVRRLPAKVAVATR